MHWHHDRCATRQHPGRPLSALLWIGVIVIAGVSSVTLSTVVVAQQPATAASVVFDKVTVVDVEKGRLLSDQRVVIVGNRISAVGAGSKTAIPRGAQVVNAQGKYLIPGLWDMHTHSRQYTDFYYPLFIANGVTGIRDAWSDVPLATQQLWRREILAGTRVGPPRQLLAGPALDGVPQCLSGPEYVGFTGHLCVTDPADARRVVDSLKAAGADIIKTYFLDRKMYFAVAAAARRAGLPFGGHLASATATAAEASDSGAAILDHSNSAGNLDKLCLRWTATVEQCQQLATQFKAHGTWFVPTLIRFATASGDYETLTHINASRLKAIGFRAGPTAVALLASFYQFASDFWKGTEFQTHWLHYPVAADQQSKPALAPVNPDSGPLFDILHRVGFPIMAGSDVDPTALQAQPPGFALHEELALYVAEGLTPLEALQTATLNPAKYLHATDSLGTVARGKLADLVLLDANPLTDITNTSAVRAVVANGRYYDRAALDHLLAAVQAQAKKEPPFGAALPLP